MGASEIFVERHPDAQRTTRLHKARCKLGLSMGSQAGAAVGQERDLRASASPGETACPRRVTRQRSRQSGLTCTVLPERLPLSSHHIYKYRLLKLPETG